MSHCSMKTKSKVFNGCHLFTLNQYFSRFIIYFDYCVITWNRNQKIFIIFVWRLWYYNDSYVSGSYFRILRWRSFLCITYSVWSSLRSIIWHHDFIHSHHWHNHFWNSFLIQERTRAYADTLGNSYDNLKRLLQLIDYSTGYFFLSVRGELRPVFIEALEKANIGIGHEYKNLFYYLPKEEALKFNTQYVHCTRLDFCLEITQKLIAFHFCFLFEVATMSNCDQLQNFKISKK